MYAQRLKELRLKNNLYQKDVAQILNLNEITYTHYENEYYLIPIKHLNTLANYYNVSLDYLFSFSNTLNYKIKRKNLDKKLIGSRLKKFRQEKGLTQKKLAHILNVGQSTIAEYERCTNQIATPFLYTICKNYQISADYLLGRIDETEIIYN